MAEPTGGDDAPQDPELLVRRLHAVGITRIASYAWRDLDDPEAGGSELHADQILRRWAGYGLEVCHRTSTADVARSFVRNGYRVDQRGGRFDVFARVAGREAVRRTPADTAVVEILNGVPWWSPVWHRGPRVTWLHHVHDRMWFDVLPRPLADLGRFVERRVAPPVYRRTTIVTLSGSGAAEVREIGFPADRIRVIPPGVDPCFTSDPSRRSPHPSVLVVGRIAPVKRMPLVLDAVATVRARVHGLDVHVVGDGPDRRVLDSWVDEHRAHEWVHLHGRVDETDLVHAYQRAWVVMSASHAEGWGMSLTEAAACGTPAVATDIAGHRGAVVDEATGLLVPERGLADGLERMLSEPGLRDQLGREAQRVAAGRSWDAVAAAQLAVVVDAAEDNAVTRRGRARRVRPRPRR